MLPATCCFLSPLVTAHAVLRLDPEPSLPPLHRLGYNVLQSAAALPARGAGKVGTAARDVVSPDRVAGRCLRLASPPWARGPLHASFSFLAAHTERRLHPLARLKHRRADRTSPFESFALHVVVCLCAAVAARTGAAAAEAAEAAPRPGRRAAGTAAAEAAARAAVAAAAAVVDRGRPVLGSSAGQCRDRRDALPVAGVATPLSGCGGLCVIQWSAAAAVSVIAVVGHVRTHAHVHSIRAGVYGEGRCGLSGGVPREPRRVCSVCG